MQNQFISAAATASADGDRGLFYMACLSVDNLGMPAPTDERQAAELAHAALVRAADTLRAQLGPAAEGDGEPSGDSSEESVADSNASDSHEEDSSSGDAPPSVCAAYFARLHSRRLAVVAV